MKDVGLTGEEWAEGIRFLTETGQRCDATRQEFILLSDVLGVSMLVESLDNPADGQCTEATVEGPFHLVDSPERELGDAIGEGGEPCLVTGRFTDTSGAPVAGARVDVWQADADGFYDVQRPGEVPERNLRGLFTPTATAGSGSARSFRAITRSRPTARWAPCCGRPAATRTGPRTSICAHPSAGVGAGVPHPDDLSVRRRLALLDSDAVFGVKVSLIRTFARVDDPGRAAEYGLPNPFRQVDFPVTVRREPGM